MSNGAVGYIYGGNVPKNTAVIFSCDSEDDIIKMYEDFKGTYGNYIACKYINVKNHNKIFDKLKDSLSEKFISKNTYSCDQLDVLSKLKELARQ
jgi:hypothetical protein